MTVEFFFAFMVLVIASFAIFEFGTLLLVQQAVVTAATEGAREAAKIGVDPALLPNDYANDIAEVVQAYLAIHCVFFNTSGVGGDARVIIERGDGVPTLERGDPAITGLPAGNSPAATEVRVTVSVPVNTGSGPVPNCLSVFGLDLTTKTFCFTARETLE